MDIHFLDVGDTQYGDCTLIVDGDVTVLIDGAHQGDHVSRPGFVSVPEQIRKILMLSDESAIRLTLLIVTHCHKDHIGCLPDLVANGSLLVEHALVADEGLGFGVAPDEEIAVSQDDSAGRIVFALQEEALDQFQTDDMLERFISDAASLPERYAEMLSSLGNAGTNVVRYRGPGTDVANIERLLKSIEFKVVGPSEEHLLLCTEQIESANEDAATAIRSMEAVDAGEIDIYRRLAFAEPGNADSIGDAIQDYVDSGGASPAKNNQSIIVSVGKGRDQVLLTGDMQFSKSEVSGLETEMGKLLAKITAAAPYAVFKVPHHGSANAFDQNVVKALVATENFVISTGKKSRRHPSPRVLKLLASLPGAQWARTDVNGLISTKIARGKVTFHLAAGLINDASQKSIDPAAVEPRQRYSPTTVSPEVPLAAPYRSSATQVTCAVADQFVEVSARIPVGVPSVTIRVEIGQPTTIPSVIPNRVATATLGAGRELPALAFVTDPDKLSRKIGSDGYRNVADLIQTSGKLLLECDSAAPYETVRRSGKAVSGVVVLGDYDVMPGAIHDALPLDIRHEIEDEIEDDADELLSGATIATGC
jgi:beta-lactamase superfamily II metal-dependent hydrolase